MNNDTFTKELKTRHEKYGITQKRLAVACGISREYYNRIENGQTNASEELKAEIQKQLERLNPLEPMDKRKEKDGICIETGRKPSKGSRQVVLENV